jgi:hypothetical protein
MLFQASEFSDVSGQWGILFSIWQAGQDDRSEWNVVLKHSSAELENPVEAIGEKIADGSPQEVMDTETVKNSHAQPVCRVQDQIDFSPSILIHCVNYVHRP